MVLSPCVFSVKNLLHGTFLANRSWRQLLQCWAIFGPLFRNIKLTKKLTTCKHSLPLLSIHIAKRNEHLFTGFRKWISVSWQNCVEYQKTARNSTDIFFNNKFHYFSQPKIQLHIESKTPNTNSNPLQCQLKFWLKILYIKKCYSFHKRRMSYNERTASLKTMLPFTLINMWLMF